MDLEIETRRFEVGVDFEHVGYFRVEVEIEGFGFSLGA